MKICFLLDDFSATGGIQTVVPIVANALGEYHDVTVLSMYQEHGVNNEHLYIETIKPISLIQGKKKYIQQAFKVVSKLKNYIETKDIDVLITCSEMLTPYAYLATKQNKIPFICWCHTDAGQSKFVDIFKSFAAKKANLIVTLNDRNQIFFKETLHAKNNVVSITNPIDPKLLTSNYNYDKNAKKIISVGRISPQKNYKKLIEVANIVCHKHPNWKWDIYGDGPEKKEIEDLIEYNKLNDFISLKGSVTDIYDRYHLYSFLVMTSKYECYPMVLLEAMANKLPMISFDITGSDNIIENNINGYLVDCFDAEKMASRICELIDSEELRIEFSIGNKDLLKKHSIETIIKMWNKVLDEASHVKK